MILTANQGRTNAHSIAIVTLHNFKLKYLSCGVAPPPINFFITRGSKRKAGSPSRRTQMDLQPVSSWSSVRWSVFGSQRSCPPPSFPKAKKLLISCHRGVCRREFRRQKGRNFPSALFAPWTSPLTTAASMT